MSSFKKIAPKPSCVSKFGSENNSFGKAAPSMPNAHAVMAESRIPMINAALSLIAHKNKIKTRLKRLNSTLPLVMSPSPTSTESFRTTTPICCKPKKAMKAPMPAQIACLRLDGMLLIIQSRKFVKAKSKKIKPDTKTAPSALCHASPFATHTPKVK